MSTREPLDAIRLVEPFGGGGHERAAGCTIMAPLAKARRLFYRAVDKMLRETPEKKAREPRQGDV